MQGNYFRNQIVCVSQNIYHNNIFGFMSIQATTKLTLVNIYPPMKPAINLSIIPTYYANPKQYHAQIFLWNNEHLIQNIC